jgi:pentatricopeptide repeat protein
VKLLARFEKHGAKAAAAPPVPLLKTLIRMLSDKGLIPALRQVSTALTSLQVEGDAGLYTTLVGAFGRAGSYDDVIQSAKLVEGKGMADKGRIYSTAVAALLEGDLPSEALQLYKESIKDGAQISRKGYEVLIAGAAASSDPSQSVFFLKELKSALAAATTTTTTTTAGETDSSSNTEPISPKVYWKPISACLRTNRLQDAAELVKEYYCEMEGTRTDPAPLNNLIKAACDSGNAADRDLAVHVFEEIQAHQEGSFVGNSFTSMVVIGAYRSKVELEKIVRLHRAMLKAGVEVWLPAASNVMYAYAKTKSAGADGDVEAELEVFKALAASPSQISLAGTGGTTNIGKKKKQQQQQQQQQEEDEQAQAQAQATSKQEEKHSFHWERILSRAMYLAAEYQRLDIAQLVLSLLQKHRGLKAGGAKDYMNLIKAFSHAQRPGDALQVLMMMNDRKGDARPSTLHYNAVLHAFVRVERMADAEVVFEEMKMRQLPLDAATFNMLISGFERARQPERALVYYDEMKKRGIEADRYVLNSLISVTADLRNRTLANGLLQRFRDMAGDPEEAQAEEDVFMYGSFMHALARADSDSRKEVLRLLDAFKAGGRKPNTIMYNEALYATYRLVREDAMGMGEKALSLFHEMLTQGPIAAPDSLTYRRLFKVLKQACRFQEIVDIAAPLPREMLVTNDRIGIPVIAASLRVGDQDRARDLLGDLVLKPNTTYATYRWATFVYCTKLDPPDLNAAETVMALVEEKGWKADRAFYASLMRGCWASSPKKIEQAFDIYHNLPLQFQGGDPAAVAALCHMDRGRLDRIHDLLQLMRQQDDVARADLLLQIIELCLSNQDWKIALEVVALMLDHDVKITRQQHKQMEAAVMVNPSRNALEILEGMSMLEIAGNANAIGGGASEVVVEIEGDEE